VRTFIAIELPEAVRLLVERRQRSIQNRLDQLNAPSVFRWTPVEKVHLTLRFLGETSDAQRGEMADLLANAAATWPRFDLGLEGLGCFPNFRQPSVVWLGVRGDLAALQHMQAEIERFSRRAGFAAEERAFRPHLTLARASRDAKRPDLQAAGRALERIAEAGETGTFTVDRIAHIKSDLRPSGAIYTVLAEFPLRG
jgi:2'-5' RNA ligase